ncbi:MAG: T9SS type A sorting domain-containing protein [Oceanospirillaceae bacterium]|nr:T9SS type A sorting domain-containing protein [Oceanospirillaceae bacterium]
MKNYALASLLFLCHTAFAQLGDIHYQTKPSGFDQIAIQSGDSITYDAGGFLYRFSLVDFDWRAIQSNPYSIDRPHQVIMLTPNEGIFKEVTHIMKSVDGFNTYDSTGTSSFWTFSCFALKDRYWAWDAFAEDKGRYSFDGVNWTATNTVAFPFATHKVSAEPNGYRLYVSNGNSFHYLSLDTGKTLIYTPLQGLSGQVSHLERAVFFNDSGIAIYDSFLNKLHVSTNNGQSWTLGTDTVPLPSNSFDINVFRGDTLVATDPWYTDSLYFSYDGGLTWPDRSFWGFEPPRAFIAKGDTTVIVDMYGSLLASLSINAPFNMIGSGSFYQAVPVYDYNFDMHGVAKYKNSALVFGEEDYFFFSNSGGDHFESRYNSLGFREGAILEGEHILLTRNGKDFHYSNDGGINVSPAFNFPSNNGDFEVKRDSVNDKIMIEGQSGFFITEDLGVSFQFFDNQWPAKFELTPAGNVWKAEHRLQNSYQTYIDVYKHDAQNVETLMHSWKADTLAHAHPFALEMLNENYGFMVVDYQLRDSLIILQTSDGWQTSKVMSSIPYTYRPTGNSIVPDMSFLSPTECYLMDCSGDIYASMDTAKTWVYVATANNRLIGAPSSFRQRSVEFHSPWEFLLTAQSHYGIFIEDGGDWITPAFGLSLEEFYSSSSEISVYPNPATDYVQIPINEAEVNIIDIEGNLVVSAHCENGRLNLPSLKTGMYILLIKSGQTTQFAKVLVN